MNRRQKKLSTLPTAGIVWSGEAQSWVPTEHGKMRADRLIELYRQGKIWAIAILGGKRSRITSEAVAYRKYMVAKCPGIESIIVIVNAKELCSNRDYPAAMPAIENWLAKNGLSKRTAMIEAVTYKKHFDRIKIVLKSLGFRADNIEWIDSGESSAYHPLVDGALTLVTRVDPQWRWPLGWFLALIANIQRISQEKQE